MTRLHWLGLTLGAVVIGGCGKEKAADSAGTLDAGAAAVTTPASAVVPSAASPAAASANATMSAAAVATQVPAETLPTERRAERKASNEINHGNYKSELAKIEKELGSP